ncbi:hypothetical protein [Natrinema sp. 74]|uniref:hypothetical protein n=1 Tax=Natrinema sp. 74 TaxID=3384159 RepID=UPI0038D42741
MSNPFDDLKDDDETDDADAQAETTTSAGTETTTAETEATADTGPATEIDAEPHPETDENPSTAVTSVSSPSEELSPKSSVASDTADESVSDTGDDGETTDETVSPAETGPAFEYSEVKQKPFYARTETVNEFENAIRTSIVPTLAEAGVLDEESREIHDAILRLANERPERVAELVLEERRKRGDQ